MSHPILGLDIGGANLKAATNQGQAATVPFALWKQPDQLAPALRQLLAQFPAVEEFALTMTGELCDCFPNKSTGVRHILSQVHSVTRSYPIRVWSTQGRFLFPDQAGLHPRDVAAANWHALASYVGRFVTQGTGLLIDIGSTTSDFIPILDGVPCSLGRTDPERLRQSELVYTGVRRTPICALLPPGEIAAEWFATTLDAYLLLGLIPESPDDLDTADQRPAIRSDALARLARLYCADTDEISHDLLFQLAERVMDTQLGLLTTALGVQHHRLRELQLESLGTKRVVFLSGSGEFLVERLLHQHMGLFTDAISLTERFGAELASAAPAYAVACLAAERPLV